MKYEEKYTINGLKLPERLIQLYETNKWTAPFDKSGIREILELPESLRNRFDRFDDYADFTTYGLGVMTSESLAIKRWEAAKDSMFLGKEDEIVKPGNIDVNKAILIADLGIGSDSPFVLDYQQEIDNPSVMIIRWGEDAFKDNRWMKIADSFESFIERIGIKS